MPPSPRNSIVLLADGLRPSMLGPYGNTWFDTTRLNQLASESLLFEQCISDSPDIQLGIRGILTGQHACDSSESNLSLPARLIDQGNRSVLVTADAEKFSAYHDDFSEIYEIESSDSARLAGDISETQLAVFFAAVTQALSDCEQPGALILDCPGFTSLWDAPLEYRMQLADPDDPEPTDRVQVPAMQFNESVDDPDQLLDFQVAYGAQIRVFDELLEILLHQIDESKWGRAALFSLTATRAFPLGEHGVVGFYRPTLYNESLQVPLLVRWPRSSRSSTRSRQVVQPGSLFELLAQWHELERNAPTTFPEINPSVMLANKLTTAVVSGCIGNESQQFAIQTAAWKYLAGNSRQLFVKPDDLWEFNDVADLCLTVADEMQQQLESAIARVRKGEPPVFELSDAVAFGVE